MVIGAGPAGLTAAYELSRCDRHCTVLESTNAVGGIARTCYYKGYRFDVGGHRFFSPVESVSRLWANMLNEDLIAVRRRSRIYYDGRYYNYPLNIGNTLSNLGFLESVRVCLSYIAAQFNRHTVEKTFEQWVTHRFGWRLYTIFFKTYTEKVWGIPCDQLRADWAAQRIQDMSVRQVVRQMITRRSNVRSMIEEFQYPRLGPGMMWECFTKRIQDNGSCVLLNHRVVRLHHDENQINSLTLQSDGGEYTRNLSVDQVVSTMPLGELVTSLSPPAPQEVLQSARSLRYRDFLIVVLILDTPHLFDDNWIYIHTPSVKVGRIQNFKSWSADMVPDENTTSLGMEYFCHQGDGLWNTSDKELISLAKAELTSIGLAANASCIDATVVRQHKAYPVYDAEYQHHVCTIRNYLKQFSNLQTIGRNGLHRYNNQDHSMVTAIMAARNILSCNPELEDVWSVNVERSYQEKIVIEQADVQ